MELISAFDKASSKYIAPPDLLAMLLVKTESDMFKLLSNTTHIAPPDSLALLSVKLQAVTDPEVISIAPPSFAELLMKLHATTLALSKT